MNVRAAILFISFGLIACSAQPPAPQASNPAAPLPALTVDGVAIPPPEISIELPLEQPKIDPSVPRLCQLGSSCLKMDERPFEPCLLDARRCDGPPPEQMQIQAARIDKPAAH